MVGLKTHNRKPFGLVVTGEAETWREVVEQIVGADMLTTYPVTGDRELLNVVESGRVDAAVLDDDAGWVHDVLQLLRMIRRFDTALPVVVVTTRRERRYLENALRLAAFSVVSKPLELEELLRQIQRMMDRLEATLRADYEGRP
ncbi:MAG: response regulator [Phycisphaerae bacterium]